ncbi:MAG: HAMP domain-containing protein [Dehalococcoidia bacterium]|nr:HAMP domain-containing protein [Dehalococcoidia bacterium]
MSFLTDAWRRIGTRLYLALGFAVLLTLGSSMVGVYYFERSGDLNFQVRSESVPALEAAWSAAREGERIRSIGLGLLGDPGSVSPAPQAASVEAVLGRLETALGTVGAVPALASDAQEVYDSAFELTRVIDDLALNRNTLLEANAIASGLRSRVEAASADTRANQAALAALSRMFLASDEPALDRLWDEFAALSVTGGVDTSLGEEVYVARGQQLALLARAGELAVAFDGAGATLSNSVTRMLEGAQAESEAALESSGRSFDEGRLLLALISVASVVAATLAAWLWVGNGLVRRLSRLSERMRGMAAGDIETPIPEVSRDEVGELAGTLEVWRQQALEVQRLNLVERLYGELREANAELERMQERLVAQGKLAALGELVSGVAHEISNPLNFVKNFTEGSLESYRELTDVLNDYRSEMKEDDVALLDEISEDLTDSLQRVHTNGTRAYAIVERMSGLGVVGGELVPTDLHNVLRTAVQTGCDTFRANWEDFEVMPEFDLDDSIDRIPMVAQDFSEAVVNLVTNACYAMRQRRESEGDGYTPALTVSTRRKEGEVAIRVRDNGTGIADDVVERIFNPFFSTREGIMGAGLGLPIAADVARRAGGDLSVDTVYGEYAEFTLTLPIEKGE